MTEYLHTTITAEKWAQGNRVRLPRFFESCGLSWGLMHPHVRPVMHASAEAQRASYELLHMLGYHSCLWSSNGSNAIWVFLPEIANIGSQYGVYECKEIKAYFVIGFARVRVMRDARLLQEKVPIPNTGNTQLYSAGGIYASCGKDSVAIVDFPPFKWPEEVRVGDIIFKRSQKVYKGVNWNYSDASICKSVFVMLRMHMLKWVLSLIEACNANALLGHFDVQEVFLSLPNVHIEAEAVQSYMAQNKMCVTTSLATLFNAAVIMTPPCYPPVFGLNTEIMFVWSPDDPNDKSILRVATRNFCGFWVKPN